MTAPDYRAQPRWPSLTSLRMQTVSVETLSKHFRVWVLVLCGVYLGLQSRYILGLPLVMDEFADAGHVHRVGQALPYRDYAPYRTVLGYYLQLPILSAFESTWAAMLAVKAQSACLTAAAMAAAAHRLRRYWSAPAILGGLLLLVTQSTFLERSSELRVDMLSALFGLFSLVAYLERRSVLAGIGAGLAVLMTQKGAYFVLSLGAATAFQVLRYRTRQHVRESALAAASVVLVVGLYVAFWSALAGPSNVWQSMFSGPKRIAFDFLYANLNSFWWQTLGRNPVFYGFALAGWLLMLVKAWRADDSVASRLWPYAAALGALCIWHKQPWPYFFVILIPTAWVLVIAAVERCAQAARSLAFASAVLLVGGSVASLALRVPAVLDRDSSPQRQAVEAAEAALRPGETYLAGTELLWRRPHTPHLSWLDVPRLRALQTRYELALAQLKREPPRLLINNYRLDRLPPAVSAELTRNYHAVGGNLRTYAPLLPEGASETDFAYGGLYRVFGAEAARVSLDGGRELRPGEQIILAAGRHRVNAVGGGRLVSWSEAPAFLAHVKRPAAHLFDAVYTY